MIDKRNKHIAYNDEAHRYSNTLTGKTYTSVTTLIKKFVQPFDEDYWSSYKALEMIMPNFNVIKYKLKSKEFTIQDCIRMVNPTYFKEAKEHILKQWKNTRDNASEKGSKYHKEKENFWKSKTLHQIEGIDYEKATTNVLEEKENGIFSELLVFNDEHSLAGQIDLCIKKGKEITLIDYKTNAKLKFNNAHQKMLNPVQHLDDCNINHYFLQLNLYKFILEAQGYKVTKMYIYHSTTDLTISVKEMSKEINDMLEYVKRLN